MTATATAGKGSAAGTGAAACCALLLGDDALVLAQRLGEWTAKAPTLEEDVALANIALDLLGQARVLLTLAGAPTGRSEDDLAYLREEREFRNLQLVEQPNGDFAHTVARQLYFSVHQELAYRALGAGPDPELAALAAKAVKEVAYHRDHAEQWTLRLGDGTEESHRRMQAGLDALWRHTGEMFDPLPGEAAAVFDPSPLRSEWAERVADVLRRAGLRLPEGPDRLVSAPGLGRHGVHTESFGYLLAEMQHLHRSHPGATW